MFKAVLLLVAAAMAYLSRVRPSLVKRPRF
jgi:hypothetical protein